MSIDAIKTWQQRCEEHPDHNSIVSEGMIHARMQEEIDELRAAIEQAQEPVAWMYEHDGMVHDADNPPIFAVNKWNTPVGEPYTETPLYTAPRQWQGLTGKEIHECWPGINVMDVSGHFYRNIEAKLREKNS